MSGIPDELLSLLLPEGRQIVKAPEGIDHDDFEDLCREYLQTKSAAHHKDSPAGRELSDCERLALQTKVVPFKGVVNA